MRALGDVLRHRGAGADGLVVGVGMDEEEALGGAGAVTQASLTRSGARRQRLTDCGPCTPESFPRQSARTRRLHRRSPAAVHDLPGRRPRASSCGRRPAPTPSAGCGRSTPRPARSGSSPTRPRCTTGPRSSPRGARTARAHARGQRRHRRLLHRRRDATVAAFALSGGLYAVDLVDRQRRSARLDVPGPVVDPRLSPDGSHVAYVSGRSLRVVGAGRLRTTVPLAEPAHELETCGLVDFVAAEELDRSRGFWWSPDSSALLVERVDETPGAASGGSPTRCTPAQAPRPHRYPAAGTANADVSLELVRLDGTTIDGRVGPRRAIPYLVDVSWQPGHGPLLVVMTRDAAGRRPCWRSTRPPGATTRRGRDPRRRRGSTPRRGPPGGRPTAACSRCAPTTPPTPTGCTSATTGSPPPGCRCAAWSRSTTSGVLVATAPDPLRRPRSRTSAGTARSQPVGPQEGWTIGRRTAGTSVLVSRTLESLDVAHRVVTGSASYDVVNHAERPAVTPVVTVIEAGERAIGRRCCSRATTCPARGGCRCCSARTAARTTRRSSRSGASFGEDQWLADQGFCVVVADGRGTPGRGPGLRALGASATTRHRCSPTRWPLSTRCSSAGRTTPTASAWASAAGRSAASSRRSRCSAAPTGSTPRSPAPP